MFRLLSKKSIRDLVYCAALLVSALGLILAPTQAMEGAKTGLTLCFNVIIPSLFPFFVLSSLLVELGLASYLGRALEPVMRPLFRVNGTCAAAVALGFVGGYPVGARTALSLYEKGLCSKTEAERLLSFCNNSGPAFILGVVGAGVFASSRVGLLLYLAHALASLLVGLIFRFYGREDSRERQGHTCVESVRFTSAFTGSVSRSFQNTLSICAFVVFFSVVITLLSRFGILTALADGLCVLFAPIGLTEAWATRLLTGLLEISSGVWSLSGAGTLAGRISMAAFMLGWAGISVHCQVLSFLSDSGLTVRTYLVGKLLHGGFSAALVWGLTRLFPLAEPVSSYLAEQVETFADMDFSTALTISTVSAWVIWLGCFAIAAFVVRKSSGKQGRRVV